MTQRISMNVLWIRATTRLTFTTCTESYFLSKMATAASPSAATLVEITPHRCLNGLFGQHQMHKDCLNGLILRPTTAGETGRQMSPTTTALPATGCFTYRADSATSTPAI